MEKPAPKNGCFFIHLLYSVIWNQSDNLLQISDAESEGKVELCCRPPKAVD